MENKTPRLYLHYLSVRKNEEWGRRSIWLKNEEILSIIVKSGRNKKELNEEVKKLR